VHRWLKGTRAISGLAEFAIVHSLERREDIRRMVGLGLEQDGHLGRDDIGKIVTLGLKKAVAEGLVKALSLALEEALTRGPGDKAPEEPIADDVLHDLLVEDEQNIDAYIRSYLQKSEPGKRLKEEREKLKFTRQQLAHRLNVKPISVYQWESGKREISPILVRGMYLVRFSGYLMVEFMDATDADKQTEFTKKKLDEIALDNRVSDDVIEAMKRRIEDFSELLNTSDFLEPESETNENGPSQSKNILRPVVDRVLVKHLDDKEEQIVGRIIMPCEGKENCVEAANRILVGKYTGEEIEIEGEKYLIVRKADVAALKLQL